MTPEETLICYHKDVLEKWVNRGPLILQEMLDFFHLNFSGFGTGLHENLENRKDYAQLIKNEHQEVPEPSIIEIAWLKAKTINNTGNTWCIFHLKVPAEGQFLEMKNLRMSLTWVKEKGKDWKAIHGHASAPWVMQQEGETWPIGRTTSPQSLIRKNGCRKNAALTIEKTENLLYNILPVEVAKELLKTGYVKPARFDEVSILFSDFKEFTNIVATIPTRKLINERNELFSEFDDIMEAEGIEKIQTVGDAYLAASGLPDEVPDHAIRRVRAGTKMIDFLNRGNETSAIKWKIRIGIYSGPLTAGVVGKKKFAYDIFGDTKNTVSRIETAGEEGKINVSAYTYDLIKDQFPYEYRGKVSANGKGDLDMYFVK